MAFSFLKGKSPFDEAEERLEAGETVNGRPKMPKAPAMGWQDGVFLLVIIGLVVGGYMYYQHAKEEADAAYARCDEIYQAAASDGSKYIEVESCYNAAMDLSFTSGSLDSLGQIRINEVADLRDAQQRLLRDAKDSLELGDSAVAGKLLKDYKGPMLLNGLGEKDEWARILSYAKVDAAPAPAAEKASAAETAPAAKK